MMKIEVGRKLQSQHTPPTQSAFLGVGDGGGGATVRVIPVCEVRKSS